MMQINFECHFLRHDFKYYSVTPVQKPKRLLNTTSCKTCQKCGMHEETSSLLGRARFFFEQKLYQYYLKKEKLMIDLLTKI